MIKIELGLAIALFFVFTLSLVLAKWIFYNCNASSKTFADRENLMQCPYCSHVFWDNAKDGIRTCPRCHSLIDSDDSS